MNPETPAPQGHRQPTAHAPESEIAQLCFSLGEEFFALIPESSAYLGLRRYATTLLAELAAVVRHPDTHALYDTLLAVSGDPGLSVRDDEYLLGNLLNGAVLCGDRRLAGACLEAAAAHRQRRGAAANGCVYTDALDQLIRCGDLDTAGWIIDNLMTPQEQAHAIQWAPAAEPDDLTAAAFLLNRRTAALRWSIQAVEQEPDPQQRAKHHRAVQNLRAILTQDALRAGLIADAREAASGIRHFDSRAALLARCEACGLTEQADLRKAAEGYIAGLGQNTSALHHEKHLAAFLCEALERKPELYQEAARLAEPFAHPACRGNVWIAAGIAAIKSGALLEIALDPLLRGLNDALVQQSKDERLDAEYFVDVLTDVLTVMPALEDKTAFLKLIAQILENYASMNGSLRGRLIQACAEAGCWDAARTLAMKAADDPASRLAAYLALGEAAGKTGDREKARSFFSEAEDLIIPLAFDYEVRNREDGASGQWLLFEVTDYVGHELLASLAGRLPNQMATTARHHFSELAAAAFRAGMPPEACRYYRRAKEALLSCAQEQQAFESLDLFASLLGDLVPE